MFRTLELSGMARVDFFLDRGTGALYVNEVNTPPGFTAISMYPKMWEASGVPPKQLVTRLIELAIERRRERRALKTEIYRKVRGLPRSRRRYVKQQW
jgi:D-alanine-D-alanine ligase